MHSHDMPIYAVPGNSRAFLVIACNGSCLSTSCNACMQVGTPQLDEAAHYLIARAHELQRMAERERPDLLVEVNSPAPPARSILALAMVTDSTNDNHQS